MKSLSEAELYEISALEEKLRSCVGAKAGPFLAWDSVNRAMIRHWCEAMGDKNPAYSESAVAAVMGAPAGAGLAVSCVVWGGGLHFGFLEVKLISFYNLVSKSNINNVFLRYFTVFGEKTTKNSRKHLKIKISMPKSALIGPKIIF